MKNTKNTFEVGKTYWTRSVCDSECIITLTVAKRTAKFLTTTEGKRLGISSWDEVEHVKPWGAYSMAPIIPADRVAKSNNSITVRMDMQGVKQNEK